MHDVARNAAGIVDVRCCSADPDEALSGNAAVLDTAVNGVGHHRADDHRAEQ
jgi:hypothetical protein